MARNPAHRTRTGGLLALALVLATGLSVCIGSSTAAPRATTDATCFGGPPIGPACGRLSESDLHKLVGDLTLAQTSVSCTGRRRRPIR
jgi:hypothetical protein